MSKHPRRRRGRKKKRPALPILAAPGISIGEIVARPEFARFSSAFPAPAIPLAVARQRLQTINARLKAGGSHG